LLAKSQFLASAELSKQAETVERMTNRNSRGTASAGWRRVAPLLVAAAAVGAGALSAPATAHHSFAQFDKTRQVTLKGTVKDWQFTNPHSWLQVIVQENGHDVEYSIEGASVNTLVRRGWGRTTFKVGDKITLVIYPLKTGQNGGAFLMATFANGKTISSGITPN
jgi:hypothetical protein